MNPQIHQSIRQPSSAAGKRRMAFFFRDFADLNGWKKRPRNGKVARLPEPVRLAINQMLDDGQPYQAILEALHNSTNPPLQHSISPMNLSNWYHGGYQDWLRDQQPPSVSEPIRTKSE